MIRKLFLTLAVISTVSLSLVSAQQTGKVTASGIGYLEYLPQGYNSNSNKYPIVISLHGIREKGTSSTDRNRVLADLQKVDNVGLPKYVLQGEKYPFILVSPQLKTSEGNWSGAYVMQVLNHVKKYLRIDDRRIYLTGLSLGGFGVWKVAGDYPHVFAAIAPICSGGNSLSKAKDIAAENLPVWGFHGSSDRIVSHNVTLKMVSAINSAPKKPNPLAKATIFQGMGHIIWDRAYKQTNLVNWMLSHRKGSAPSFGSDDGGSPDDGSSNHDDSDDSDDKSTSNKSPVVKAGSDKSITLPANSINIHGSASDPDGKIASYKWTKISGGSAGMSGTNSPKFRAYNLKEGTYVFRLTAKDNDGASKSDDMQVVVSRKTETKAPEEKKASSKNILPVASAGPDRVITLPTNSITVKAAASDKDGKIVSYEWSQTYGNRVSLSGANSAAVKIFNMKKGHHIFRLRVKDNDGGVKDDYFKITVNGKGSENSGKVVRKTRNRSGSKKSNALPQAYAGADRVITLPTNSINIQATASDRDGKIVSYEWTKTYGNRASIGGGNSSNVRIYNLREGAYIFRLRVRDNDGGVKDDYFKITVKGAPKKVAANNTRSKTTTASGNARPVANAGPDLIVKKSRGSVQLAGSGKDRDGRIVSYKWKKLAGPDATVKNAHSSTATVSNLKEGRYYFSLTVKDDDDQVHVDKMALRVTGS